jgi:hypothetical protein
MNGFIDHLYTSLGTTSNYNAIYNLNTLQITTAPAKPFFQPTLPSSAVPWQRLLTVETRLVSIFTATHAELNSQPTTDK